MRFWTKTHRSIRFFFKYSEGHFPRNFPRDNSLGKFRGTDPSEYTEGTVPRNKPRKKSVGILLSIDVYMSKHASIDELPRNYPDEVLPRYIPRTFPTNKGSSEFPRKFISSEFRRKIPRDFRGKKKFRGIISDDVFRRNCVGITIFRRNSDDFFPQYPCCFLVVSVLNFMDSTWLVPLTMEQTGAPSI